MGAKVRRYGFVIVGPKTFQYQGGAQFREMGYASYSTQARGLHVQSFCAYREFTDSKENLGHALPCVALFKRANIYSPGAMVLK